MTSLKVKIKQSKSRQVEVIYLYKKGKGKLSAAHFSISCGTSIKKRSWYNEKTIALDRLLC